MCKMQDDDSQDWAEMRSWLVWCLRDKLGDADVLTSGTTNSRSSSPHSVAVSTSSRGPRQLVRQQAVHERSPRIGVVDCSGPTPPGSLASERHLLRCRSAETGHSACVHPCSGASLDGSGGDAASVAGRLTVGASCSGQSSFESYGSTGWLSESCFHRFKVQLYKATQSQLQGRAVTRSFRAEGCFGGYQVSITWTWLYLSAIKCSPHYMTS